MRWVKHERRKNKQAILVKKPQGKGVPVDSRIILKLPSEKWVVTKKNT
jgi:hypothetical protein